MQTQLDEFSFTDRKIDLIFRLYIDPADEDYLAARISYQNGLFNHFYWCAAQTCEKLLKAFLLFQDVSTKSYGHDLVRLLNDAAQLDPQNSILAPLNLPETSAKGRDAWQGKPTTDFVSHLARFGSPDNRYGFEGAYISGPLLHCLDRLCAALRCLMRATNFIGGHIFQHQNASAVFDQIEDEAPWMINPDGLLERLFVGRFRVGQSSALRVAFANMNNAFFQERAADEKGFGGLVLLGSPLHNHLVRLATLDDSVFNQNAIKSLREWADAKIQMSREVRRNLGLAN